MATQKHRSGFAALIGRPNVGKSTLLNRLTGEKLAIVSHKPQTTRNRILGVVTRPEGQVAFLDTPGVHPARGELNRFMVEVALRAIEEVDLVLFLIEAQRGAPEVDRQDRFILEQIQRAKKPSLLVINKIDELDKPRLLPLMDLYQKEFPFLEVMPVSAKEGDGVEELFRLVLSHLPEGPALFDEDMLTDQQERTLVAELIREQVLHKTHQEVPYSAAVVVDAFDEAEREPKGRKSKRAAKEGGLAGLIRIFATLYVERESQKAIVIGKRGAMLKAIGSDARRSIERMLGTHVYLSLQVKVEEHWSERREGLRKLGYE